MVKKVLNEVVANYDFKQEVTTPVEELLGIEIQFPTAVSIDLKEEFIYKFGTLVEEKSGKFLGLLIIRRKRIYWQSTPDEVNEEVRDALDARQRIWPWS